ncbi:nuclease-related domain-containing protein [Bhargavaea cecembensis]|uniref:nuclease-related domain-containing protein n=1 Tax=Bhargavaea cecembensis TaxID=394098 RepID=UPI0018D46721|nr:nuclease-related domain-containing protein [Bhargavaea cecembensis]
MDERSADYLEIGEQERAMTFGWLGERRVDQFVARSGIHPERIITNLTLHQPTVGAVQLDTIIVTNSRVLLLEVKNIHGTLELESAPARLKRTAADGVIQYFGCPYTQLTNATAVLSRRLDSHRISLPVEGALILAAKNSEPKFPKGHQAYFPSELPGLIHRANNESKLVNNEDAIAIAAYLRRLHSPFNPFPLASSRELTGLYHGSLCSLCDGHLRIGSTRKTDCRKCGASQWMPYTENLIDYFLIWGDTLTSRQCEAYLGVKGTKAKSLLRSGPFIRHLSSHRTYYTLDYSAVRLNSNGKLML